MKYVLLGLLLSTGISFTMERNTNEVEQLIEKKASELSTEHKARIEELEKRFNEYAVKIKLLENRIHNQTTIPDAPALIATAKLPTPPTPEKPQSFLKQNKKAIIVGGVGLGILTAGGLLWCLNQSTSTPIQRDWYNENAG